MRSENCAKTIKYKKETEGEKELLLIGWDGTEVLKHFIRGFYQWEMIHENCIMNSAINSGML